MLGAMASAEPSPTPNPNAMKFTLDFTLPETVNVKPGDDTGGDPFLDAVLGVEGVVAVFGTNDFVTVSQEPDADWQPIIDTVQDAAAAHL